MTHEQIMDLHFPEKEDGDTRRLFYKPIDSVYNTTDASIYNAHSRFGVYAVNLAMNPVDYPDAS